MASDTQTYSNSASTPHFVLHEGRTSLPARYVELARQTISDADQHAEYSNFLLIAQSALAALHLFFSAALHEPTEWELDVLFETFVRACVMSSRSGGQK